LPTDGEQKFRCLDLTPEQFRDPNGTLRTKTALHRWGTARCFMEEDLYTVKYGRYQSNEIEKFFFGQVDDRGSIAVDFFSKFVDFNSFDGAGINPSDMFNWLLNYMSIQKFRTPKGLAYLSKLIGVRDKNTVLIEMQRLQNLHCAIWTESVWSIADASNSTTKFILSDHPVTVYNREIFPESAYAKEFGDPDFRMNGTHTFFPLSAEKILILTNLSWARNPYGNAKALRPNSRPFRNTIFNFTSIYSGRKLEKVEVNQINFITKSRAKRYIAASNEEWLYPERHIPSDHWRKLDDLYLFMPDPRDLHLGGQVIIGYGDGRADSYDEYGRRPWERAYQNGTDQSEERGLHAFQGEFARLFGPRRRGSSNELGGRRSDIDTDDFHQYHLNLEETHFPKGFKRRKGARSIEKD